MGVSLPSLHQWSLEANEQKIRTTDFLRLQRPEPIAIGPVENHLAKAIPAKVDEFGIKGQSVYTALPHIDIEKLSCNLFLFYLFFGWGKGGKCVMHHGAP